MEGSRTAYRRHPLIVRALGIETSCDETAAALVEADASGLRLIAQQLAHPDRVDRSIEALQHVAHQLRQGKDQQGARQRSLGQIAPQRSGFG